MKLLEINVLSFSLSLIHKNLTFFIEGLALNTSNKFSYSDPVKSCKKNNWSEICQNCSILVLKYLRFLTGFVCLCLSDYPSGERAQEEELEFLLWGDKER